MKRKALLFAAVFLAVGSVACSTPTQGSARKVNVAGRGDKAITQAELQQDLQRFTADLMASVSEAGEPLMLAEPKTRALAMRRILLYASSALDIATESTPELGLLDMIVFVTLSHHVLERHWVPQVLGEEGRPLAAAFGVAEKNVWKLAAKVMNDEQQGRVRRLIDDWIRENPERVRVEEVRFGDFSLVAGRLSAERAAETGGIFGRVEAATRSVDDALLLGERALFLAHRMPFLVRLQARLGASEVMTDALAGLPEVQTLTNQVPKFQPLVHELVLLANDSHATLTEARATLDALPPLLEQVPPQEDVREMLGSMDRLVDRTHQVLEDLNALVPEGGEAGPALSMLEDRADRMVRRWIAYLLVLGAAWSLFFWVGYYVFKRRTSASDEPAPPRHAPPGAPQHA